MSKSIYPENYHSDLNLHDTQVAIKTVKDFFQRALTERLNLCLLYTSNALKEEGWEFASHTWGHLSVTDKTVDELKTDNEKWVANVQNKMCIRDSSYARRRNEA